MGNGPQSLWHLGTWSLDGDGVWGSGVQVVGLSGGNNVSGGRLGEKHALPTTSLLSPLPVCV